jgi:CheY-like chemotaxis protein
VATILLVEDNEDDVEIAKRTVARSGVAAHLQVVRDGREAMEALQTKARERSGPPIVVLLDLLLPASHGVDVIQAIRADRRLQEIPIVVLTGCSDMGLLRRCVELGINMYLLKPLDIADVMNILLGVRRYWSGTGQGESASESRVQPALQRS